MNADKLGTLAINAWMYALAATIKPGLVDRHSAGTRKGADFFTELRCINAVSPWLIEVARESINSAQISPTILFSNIRKTGIKMEEDMIKASGGLSIHRGILFCLTVSIAAAGRAISSHVWPNSNTVCALASEMAQGICERELETLDVKIKLIGEHSLTSGERVFKKYGFTGVRGEVQGGFTTVRKHALPVIKKLSADKKITLNDIYVQTFMTLMAYTDDTGICAKESDLAVEEIRDRAYGILERGGVLTPIGREKIEKLDRHMCDRGIYPGASGALITVAIFLSMLDEEEENIKKSKKRF